MTRAIRSPGSTLKPFIYGLAIEDGFVHPESLIDDRPIRYGSYAPENFDMSYQGTVTLRKALQLSLNVPAIALLERVGPHRLTARIKQAGGDLVLPKDETPGLAMGLGGVGVTLSDLVQLYAGFPRLGSTVPLRERLDDPRDETAQRRLMDPTAAWHIGNVLMGTPPPENGVHNRIAFKTGTSYGYRDAWSVGFDGRYDHRRLGRPAGRRTGSGSARPDRRGSNPVRRLCAHRQDSRLGFRRRRAARWSPPPQNCRCRCGVSAPRANCCASATIGRRASSFH